MPTNDWWSSLAWKPFALFPHPLAVKAEPGGLRVAYPGANITANKAASSARCRAAGRLHHRPLRASPLPEAPWRRLQRLVRDALRRRRESAARFGHGSPFVYVTIEGGAGRVEFANAPKVWADGAGRGARHHDQRRHYGLFAPQAWPAAWSDLASGGKWTCAKREGVFLGGRAAGCEAGDARTVPALRARPRHRTHGWIGVTTSRARCRDDTVHVHDAARTKGRRAGTFFALYPHQWRNYNECAAATELQLRCAER